jgi:hypothetical protein
LGVTDLQIWKRRNPRTLFFPISVSISTRFGRMEVDRPPSIAHSLTAFDQPGIENASFWRIFRAFYIFMLHQYYDYVIMNLMKLYFMTIKAHFHYEIKILFQFAMYTNTVSLVCMTAKFCTVNNHAFTQVLGFNFSILILI